MGLLLRPGSEPDASAALTRWLVSPTLSAGEKGFAENLGVLINLKEVLSLEDAEHQRLLTENAANRCFAQAVPRTSALQHASHFAPTERSYATKYPGDSASAMHAVCQELLDRLAAANT